MPTFGDGINPAGAVSDRWIDESDQKPGRVIVFHSGYGCDTGCVGHVIKADGYREFVFDSPFEGDDKREWAEDLVRSHYGEEHVKDLDWENCWVVED